MLIMVIVATSLFTVALADGIKIVINGQNKVFDVMPQIINGRTLVPMRGIFEEFGAEIEWKEQTRTVRATLGETVIVLCVGVDEGKVNDKDVQLDVAPQIIDGRTMVPVRFVAESLGCKVDWDGSSQTVIINKNVQNSGNAGNLTVGEIVANEYRNESLGIGFRLPGGFVFKSKSEINELYGVVGDIMKIEDYLKIMEESGSYIDMMALNAFGDNIQISVNKSVGESESDYCKTLITTLADEVVSYGMNIKDIYTADQEITGGKLNGIYLSSEYNGVNLYQLVLVKNTGNVTVIFTISTRSDPNLNIIAKSLFVKNIKRTVVMRQFFFK